MTLHLTGKLDHGHKIDPTRPFILAIPRQWRGVNWHYTYDNKQAALADFQAAKKANFRPSLRDFSNPDHVVYLGK